MTVDDRWQRQRQHLSEWHRVKVDRFEDPWFKLKITKVHYSLQLPNRASALVLVISLCNRSSP